MKTKKIITLSLFAIGMIILFVGVFYFVDRHVESSYNIRLRNTINNASMIIPPSFADSATGGHQINQLAYDSIRTSLNKIAKINEVSYVYAVIQKKGRIYFVVSSYTVEDVKENLVSDYLSEYSDAPDGISQTFKTEVNNLVFDDYHDVWGGFHSLFILQQSTSGTKYVIGADFKSKDLMKLKWMTSIIIIGVIIILGLLIFPLALAFTRYR